VNWKYFRRWGAIMSEEKKEPLNFLKLVEGIRADEKAQLKEAYKQMRVLYLDLIEAGFDMIEAMALIAAICRPPMDKNGGKNEN
jgi:hypothetical protein